MKQLNVREAVFVIYTTLSVTASLVSCSYLNNNFDGTIINKQLDSNEHPDSGSFGSNLEPAGRATSGSFRPTSNNSTPADTLVHEREFVSSQVRVQMECQRDKTIIKINFAQPFNGILGSGRLDTTKCRLNGNGTKYYEISVDHNETQCDTQWDSSTSSITNTLFIRFHQSLETGSDIAKNIMCRLTVGDLVVGRRPVKSSNQNRNSSVGISSSPKASTQSQLVEPNQLTDKVASNSVSTLNEQGI